MLRFTALLMAFLALSSCAYAEHSLSGAAHEVGNTAKMIYDAVKEHTIKGIQELVPAHTAASAQTDPKRKLLWTPGDGVDSFQNFLKDLYGRDWSQYVPDAWSSPSFGWDKLGTFDYTSNMHDFVDAVYAENITKPHSLKDVHENLEEFTSIFCTPEKFTPSTKVYATCVGPSVTLAYVPKVCVLEDLTKEIVCDPAKIVLSKAPGGCTHKYHSPSSWKGKECKIKGGAGFTQELTYGGAPYSIPMASLSWGWEANP